MLATGDRLGPKRLGPNRLEEEDEWKPRHEGTFAAPVPESGCEDRMAQHVASGEHTRQKILRVWRLEVGGGLYSTTSSSPIGLFQ